jgi:hypothetical protein
LEVADVVLDGPELRVGVVVVYIEIGDVVLFEPFPGGEGPGKILGQLL